MKKFNASFDNASDDSGFFSANKKNKKDKRSKSKAKFGLSRLMQDTADINQVAASKKNLKDITPLLVFKAKLPVEYWSEGWLFSGISDLLWRVITAEIPEPFPKTLRAKEEHYTHYGYVIREISNTSIELCPLSSKNFTGEAACSIPAGRKLDITGHVLEQTSYLVQRAISQIPRNSNIFKVLPTFLGVYPPTLLNLDKE